MNDKLKQYAKFLQKIREFFKQCAVLEVSTKSLLNLPTSDCNIDSILVQINTKLKASKYYLHTSPELEMKKLIAAGSGDIYQICKVYRDNEIGERNFNEFSMLEYYLLGFNDKSLSENVIKLFNFLNINGNVTKFSYTQIFIKFTGIEINCSFLKLKNIAKLYNLTTDFNNIANLQSLLFVHLIEAKLKKYPICIIYDFPISQSALAKIKNGVAKRFEIYLNGIEIANGYDELVTANEYKKRFLQQLKNKEQLDQEFLQSLKIPLPQCAGVAIGLDRLFGYYFTEQQQP